MKVNVEAISINNIRNFVNPVELSFTNSKDDIKYLTFLHLPNGTGKTTTLNLIKYTLSRYAFSSNEIKEFDPKSLHPHGKYKRTGSFSIRLRIYDNDANYQRFECLLEFDFLQKTHKYYTIKVASGGKTPGISLPKEFTDLCTPSILDYYVFDGELAKKFLNKEQNHAQTILKSMLLLDKIELLKEKTDDVLERRINKQQQNTGSKAKGKQKIKKLKDDLKHVKETKINLLNQIKSIQNRINNLKNDISDDNTIIEKRINEDKSIATTITNNKLDINLLSQDIDKKFEQLHDLIIDPMQYSKSESSGLKLLVDHMIKKKLPEGVAREFFLELMENPNSKCICGEQFTKEMRSHLTERQNDFLESNEIAVLNEIKFGIHNSSSFNGNIDEIFNDVEELNNQKNLLIFENQQFSDNIDDVEYRNAQQRLEDNKKKLILEEDKHTKLTTNDPSIQKNHDLMYKNNIVLCNRSIKYLEEDISVFLDMNKFYEKTIKFKDIIDKMISKSILAHKNELIKNTTEKIQRIHPEISIDDLSNYISIRGRANVSEGQGLATAYSYLSSIFEKSQLKLPFFLDSPSAKLDTLARKETGTFLATESLFSQILIFIIDTEIDNFVDQFENNYIPQYITMWVDKNTYHNHIEIGKQFFLDFDPTIALKEARK